jgi:ribosomal protein L11 methyltransferase
LDWCQFVMNLDSLDPATVEDAFSRLGAHSITLSDAGDDPVLEPGPGETPLWSSTRITGLFPGDADMDEFRAVLLEELGLAKLPAHHIEELADRAWEREWLRDFGPMRFGERLWICPTGSQIDDKDAVVVNLDPGLAFGTGTHPTTALCLEWLDGIELKGKALLDYGCGSGVLAIAGLKLGCSSATAMDIDPQAVVAARQNAADNDVAENLLVTGSPDGIEGQFDVVVANILAGPLAQFADSITSTLSSRGMLALSGVLCEQADEVMAAYKAWIEFEEPVFREQDGQLWSRLTGWKR